MAVVQNETPCPACGSHDYYDYAGTMKRNGERARWRHCKPCAIKRTSAWKKSDSPKAASYSLRHAPQRRARAKEHNRFLRERIMKEYGKVCLGCGNTNEMVLD